MTNWKRTGLKDGFQELYGSAVESLMHLSGSGCRERDDRRKGREGVSV